MDRFHFIFFVRSELKDLAEKECLSPWSLYIHFSRCFRVGHYEMDEYKTLRLYRYSLPEVRKFLSFREIPNIQKILNAGVTEDERRSFNEKHFFDATMSDFIHREWLYLPDSNIDQVRSFFARHSKALLKPNIGSMGCGIEAISSDSVDVEAFMEEYGQRPFVLESYIVQHPEMASLNPTSVNTIRVQTARIGKDICIVGCTLRCGGKNAHVDNFHNGGVGYPVDPETGIVIGSGCTSDYGFGILKSPSTERIIVGFQIPFWDEVLETVKRAALVPEHFGYLGWDVAITPEGPELIEVNLRRPCNIIIQLDGHPVGEKLRNFIKEHK